MTVKPVNKQRKYRYQSSVMQYVEDDPSCAVCRYLNGSNESEDYLEVIRTLDLYLAEAENQIERMTNNLYASTQLMLKGTR